MIVSFRPLQTWQHGDTRGRRGRLTFRATLRDSVILLEDEIRKLSGGGDGESFARVKAAYDFLKASA